MLCYWQGMIFCFFILGTASLSGPEEDCFQYPEICSVKPFETCELCNDGSKKGCCVQPPEYGNCYLEPGKCPKDTWCQLNDRKSWNDTDSTTMGRCVKFQEICESCETSFQEDNPPIIPALNAFDFLSRSYSAPLGTLIQRTTRCNPNSGLICTGNIIRTLPATCVKMRNLPQDYDTPTKEKMYDWGLRMLRMGARNLGGVSGRGPRDQLAQGNPRDEIYKGANEILKVLWNSKVWDVFQTLKIETTYNELCCRWDNYTKKLSDFQSNRTGAEYRNPLNPNHKERGNAPPCIWCSFDGAYNDENPSIWSLIHALTFNLDAYVTELQFQVLQSLPMWLRQHLSCPLCRSHIHEHLINYGIPSTRNGQEWAHFFWRAHNYVNEQSEVTRCGSQSCAWGVWQTPPAYKCAGDYRYPWFMTFETATKQWRMITQHEE